MIASVLVADTSPGAKFLSCRSKPFAPIDTTSPGLISSPPFQTTSTPSITAFTWLVAALSVLEPPPIAIELSIVARAPIPMATAFVNGLLVFPARVDESAAIPIATPPLPACALTP